MRAETKTCAAITMVAGLMLVTLAPREAGASDDALAIGQEIYEEFCAACHGYDGVKQIPEAPNFARCERLEKDDETLLVIIAKGKGDLMPPWAEELTGQQMRQVLAYIRTFPAKAGRRDPACKPAGKGKGTERSKDAKR